MGGVAFGRMFFYLITGLVGCANKGQISGTAYDGYLNSPNLGLLNPISLQQYLCLWTMMFSFGIDWKIQQIFHYEGLMHCEG